MDREIRELFELAKSTPGVRVTEGQDGFKVFAPSGFSDPRIPQGFIHVHYTPGTKGHNLENIKQKLRRIGVPVPHRGGKKGTP